ncbi:hypothetical protein D3C72_721780 [compost metagenome]
MCQSDTIAITNHINIFGSSAQDLVPHKASDQVSRNSGLSGGIGHHVHNELLFPGILYLQNVQLKLCWQR